MISLERQERYKDFVDPDRTGAPYDPRQGLERLLGVLSPEPKGIVLAAMGEDWYRTYPQLQSRIFSWLGELGIQSKIWPVTIMSNWSYIEHKDKNSGQIEDGSLVNLGAVVKKIEQDPFKLLYQRSLAGAELAVPLVQQAVRFVVRSREYAESKDQQGKEFPKFDSMWRIIGSVNSTVDQRKPLSIFDIVNFLVHHSSSSRKYRLIDLQNETHLSRNRLSYALFSLGSCGIIDYISPETEKQGQRGSGWAIYTLVSPKEVVNLNSDNIYRDIRNINESFFHRANLTQIIDYIRQHPDDEYENGTLARRLEIKSGNNISRILSLLEALNILKRPDSGFKGGDVVSAASANDLTYLFYDLVCAPAKEVADTLLPLPFRSWQRDELTVFLQNYNEERSHHGPQGGEDARRLLVEILSATDREIKVSYLVNLFNDRSETELKSGSIGRHLKVLLRLGVVEQPRSNYYRLAKN